MLDPPVKIQLLHPIFVNQLTGADHPILQKLLGGSRLTVQIVVIPLRHGRPIKISLLSAFGDVAVKLPSVSHKKPVLNSVSGCPVHQPPLFHLRRQLPQHIPSGPHLVCIPAGYFTFVHLKAVMMLRHRHHISGTGPAEKIHPFCRVKFFGFKHRNKVLIAKFLLRAVNRPVMLIFRASLNIHIAGIPLTSKRRDTIDAPVNKNTEFRFPEPFWCTVIGKRIPIVPKWSSRDHLFDLPKPRLLVIHKHPSFSALAQNTYIHTR